MLAPHWLDDAIRSKLATGNAKEIAASVAAAITDNPDILEAIEQGLREKPPPDLIGPSHVQIIREKVKDVIVWRGRSWGRSGPCPQCGLEYRWDGQRCQHCGHLKGG